MNVILLCTFTFMGGRWREAEVIWQFCTHATGSGKQLSKFSLILCNLCTPGSIYWSTSRPTRNRYLDRDISINQFIGRVLVGILTDILVEWLSDCRWTCRSIDCRHSADTSLILGYLVDCSLHCRRNLT